MIMHKHYVMKDKVKLFITVGRSDRGEAQWRMDKGARTESIANLVNKSNRNPQGMLGYKMKSRGNARQQMWDCSVGRGIEVASLREFLQPCSSLLLSSVCSAPLWLSRTQPLFKVFDKHGQNFESIGV
jgi:hypothetical protein